MSTKEAQFVDFDGLRIEYDARVLAPRRVDGGPVALGRGADQDGPRWARVLELAPARATSACSR